MKLPLACLLLLTSSCAAIHSTHDAHHGHDGDKVHWVDYGEDPMANPEFMNAMMQAGTPGPQHAELAKGVGHYRVETHYWMGPDQPAMPMDATANVEMILDGRYMVQEWKSDFMGMPFEGRLIMGFNNLTQEYWSLWIDSSSTGYSISTGKENENGDIVLHGMMHDPLTPHGRPYRSVSTQAQDGDFMFTMYDSTPDGGEFKVMEMKYIKQ